jgi:hypothetical protein
MYHVNIHFNKAMLFVYSLFTIDSKVHKTLANKAQYKIPTLTNNKTWKVNKNKRQNPKQNLGLEFHV